jgi:predicted transcriptional regulator
MECSPLSAYLTIKPRAQEKPCDNYRTRQCCNRANAGRPNANGKRCLLSRYATNDGFELVFVGIHVFLGYVERRPMTVSRLSRALGMSRATVVRRLETLIEVGYVKRQENFYCPEEGVINTPYLRDVLARASKIVITTAKELSKMDTEA